MKIYIACAHSFTGGTKTLHQMANGIYEFGHEVYMVYYNKAELIEVDRPLYTWCKCPTTVDIEDKIDNFMIAPESMTYVFAPFVTLRRVIYWLSLNFYFWSIPHDKVMEKLRLNEYPTIMYPLAYWHLRKSFINKKVIPVEEFKNLYHLYNCEYAKRFLLDSGVSESQMHYLCGPIEESFTTEPRAFFLSSKKNLISYNVNKDKVVIKKLNAVLTEIKKRRDDIKLVPIENMSRDEVKKSLIASKLFLDLGSFPGPERIPREAVLAYANLLVLDNGAASNQVDYPIPRKYKMKNLSSTDIALKSISMVDDYLNQVDDFLTFREKVIKQRMDFERDIYEIFSSRSGILINL